MNLSSKHYVSPFQEAHGLSDRLAGLDLSSNMVLSLHVEVHSFAEGKKPTRKPPSALSPGPPPGHPNSDRPPLGGAGSARPQGRHWLYPGISHLGHRALDCSSMNMVMPQPASGLAMRARRPRPSEKTTPRALSKLGPARPSVLRQSPLGGAGSARP